MTPEEETAAPESTGSTFVPIGDQTNRRAPTEAELQGPGEQANIALLMTEDELKKLASACLRDFESDVNSRSGRMKRLKEIVELYALVPKAKSRPFQGAANVMTPILTGPVLQISARLYDMVWPLNGQVVHSISTTVADLYHANATEKFANSYLRYKMPEMPQGMDDTCNQVCLFGSSFRRVYWDAAAHRVRADWIPMEDFVVAHHERSQDPSMRDVERYTMVQHLTIYDLEDLRDAGVFSYDDDKIKAEATPDEGINTSAFTESVRKIDGSEPSPDSTAEDQPRQVLEMHRRWRLPKRADHPAFDGKAHPVMVTIDERSETILRVALREEDDPDDLRRFQNDLQRYNEQQAQFAEVAMAAQQMGRAIDEKEIQAALPPAPRPVRKREICFFTHYRCFGSEGFYGLGYGDMLYGLCKATNTTINQKIDGVTINNSRGGLISRQMKMQRGEITMQPGVYVEVDMPPSMIRDAIVNLDPVPSDPSTVPLLQLYQVFADKIAGSGDTMSGQIPGSNQTAEGMKLLVEQMNLPITVLSRRISAAFSHELEKIWRCWGVFLKDYEIADIVNDNGQPEQLPIGRAMFSPTARVVPASDPRLKSQRVNESNAITQAAGHPFITGGPGNPPHPNAAQIMEAVVSQQFSTLGADRLVPMLKLPPPPPPPPPPEPMPPFAEHAHWLRGQDVPVHPMDDDQAHIQEHQAFLASPEAQQFYPPQGQEMAMNHIRHHLAALIEKQNGGGQMPPGAPNGQPPGPPPGPQGPMGQPQPGGPQPMAPGPGNGPVPAPPPA